MSRVILLSMNAEDAVTKCRAAKVGVSAVEAIPAGGVRLVCMSSDGAETMRKKLKSHVIHGDVVRERIRPVKPLW
jgi:hypothetical protein